MIIYVYVYILNPLNNSTWHRARMDEGWFWRLAMLTSTPVLAWGGINGDLSSSDVSGVIKCSNEKSDKKMETSNVEMRNVHL